MTAVDVLLGCLERPALTLVGGHPTVTGKVSFGNPSRELPRGPCRRFRVGLSLDLTGEA
jgi:hypothetical protein